MSSDNPDLETAEPAFSLYPDLRTMCGEFSRYRRKIPPSKYQQVLNRKILRQLASSQHESFKRTLVRNYFTWIVNPFSDQLRFLMGGAGSDTRRG